VKKYPTNKISLFLRSLLFSVSMVTITIIYSFICILAKPLPFYYRNKLIVFWTGMIVWLLKVICCVDYRIEGAENIPADRNGIVLSKHQSTWETFFLQSFFHQPAIILKRELLWVPFFGWGLSIIDPIAINRSDKSSALEQIITQGRKCLEAGRWVLVFPEGTRIPYGKVGKYRAGGTRLAVATGYPVIPVAHNAGRFWARRQFIKYPGTIQVKIGPLIETKDKTAEEVLAQAKDWIEAAVLQMDRKE
jgi:1-acyl-sn-glycerol-3-phosphate acyltransferase